jgi:hypothetical protein
VKFFNLDPAVERARVSCGAARWRGVTTRRARAREEEQHGQRAATQLTRVCSVCTQAVKAGVSTNINIHAVLPVDESGQLSDLLIFS